MLSSCCLFCFGGLSTCGVVLILILRRHLGDVLFDQILVGYAGLVLLLVLLHGFVRSEAPSTSGWKLWHKVLLFLLLACALPVCVAYGLLRGGVLANAGVELPPHAAERLEPLLLYVAALAGLGLWIGCAEKAAEVAVGQKISDAPLSSWIPPVLLSGTVASILIVASFTQLLPGARSSVIAELSPPLRVAYKVFVALLALSFLRVMTSQSGRPEDITDPPSADSRGVVMSLSGESWPMCKACERNRPPQRCHHCSKCGHCVLKMDHHCPWLRRCIGFQNYKSFFILLVYAVVVFIVTIIAFFNFLAKLDYRETPVGARILLVVTCTILGFLTCAVTAFLAFHGYLIATGRTTLEFIAARGPASKACYSYDQGVFRNIQSALGWNPLLWLLPVCPPDGDGATFEASTLISSGNLLPTEEKTSGGPAVKAAGDDERGYSVLKSDEPPPELTGTGIVDGPPEEAEACACAGGDGPGKLARQATRELADKIMETVVLEVAAQKEEGVIQDAPQKV
eukprot:TRINITY_DN23256_c0_g1_i1.p1 TRINITY_DN23256_c0_g1~~TRINITY_DN23256_c0_g1_i1.p1  ORF type:complete len:512 (-),score=72.29 TRINITY_DN23256_c0_g1_i1:88-1623(-)